MPLYPLFADLRQRAVLVIGGGAVAARKVEALLRAGAVVTVGAPVLDAGLAALAAEGRIRHRAGRYVEEWLDDSGIDDGSGSPGCCWLVVVATDDAALNRRVAAAAERRRLFANVVDDAELSSFHVPAVVDRAPLQIAISSGGAAPMLARLLRERFETALDAALGPLATLAARFRTRIRARHPEPAARRRFYSSL